MLDGFQSLYGAVLGDDRARAEALLKTDPALAKCTVEQARLESQLPHWIYAGDTALHVAAAGCRVEIARMLLAAGADPGSAKNHRASQPLHYAVDGCLESPSWDAKRQVLMVDLLIHAGGDIHAADKNGATPLHRAVRTRCAAAVNCLLDAGADATRQNKPGSTPFHLAVQNTGRGGSGAQKARIAQREIIQAFLARGISPALQDRNGKSVLEWARTGWIHQMLAGKNIE